MKILGINGSPVKGGNVDVLIRKVIEGAKSEIQDARCKIQDSGCKIQEKIVYLDDLKITPCKSCESVPDTVICSYQDDMEKIYPKVLTYDLFVFGSPVYFDSVSAQMKLFVDRCNCIRPLRRKSEGFFEKDGEYYFDKSRIYKFNRKRKGIIILVAGKRQRFDCALSLLKGLFKWVGIEFYEKILYSHDSFEIGKVEEDKEVLEKAFPLGKRLAETFRETQGT